MINMWEFIDEISEGELWGKRSRNITITSRTSSKKERLQGHWLVSGLTRCVCLLVGSLNYIFFVIFSSFVVRVCRLIEYREEWMKNMEIIYQMTMMMYEISSALTLTDENVENIIYTHILRSSLKFIFSRTGISRIQYYNILRSNLISCYLL